MKTISRYIMTLALLLTVATGAWAQETPLVTIYASIDFRSGSQTFDNKVTATFNQEVAFSTDNGGWFAVIAGDKTLTIEPVDGVTITRVKFYTTLGNDEVTTAPFVASMNYTYVYVSGNSQARYHVSVNGSMIGAENNHNYLQKIEVYGTAEPPIVVEPGEAANTWTFNQPGGDVVLTPIYAKAAEFATKDTESGVKLLAPAAAEGVIAGTDAPLIVEGTGIVAFAGTSTEATQGTVMYAVTAATATEAPALTSSDWKTTVPTAKNIADDGAEVKVWYYIVGADAPATVAATADNTFNNSDIESLNVTVLSNKFDLTLKAANANTIDATQASKGTVSVKVGDAAAVDKTKDITNGKLTAIKMGSEVKLNTKAGYKFRKVVVKKKEKTYTITPRNQRVAYDYGNLTNEATLPYNTTTSELMKKVGLSSVNNSYNIQSVSLTSGSNVTLGTPTGTPGERGYEVPLTITGEGEFVLTVGRTSNNNDAIIKVFVRAN